MVKMREGGCLCGRLRYRLTAPPIVVNCCHCRDCQRLSGSAFAINAMIETSHVQRLGPSWSREDEALDVAGGSRRWCCVACGVLLFADHHLFADAMRFVRVGTLDRGEEVSPDAHFFVRSKHPWVVIPDGVPAFETLPQNGFGIDLSAEARARFDAAMGTAHSSA